MASLQFQLRKQASFPACVICRLHRGASSCDWLSGGIKGTQGPRHSPTTGETWSWWDHTMAWVPLLLAVLAHTSGSLVQAALTQPSSLSHRVGDTVNITCSGSSYNWYGWYQQKVPGSALVTVIYANNSRPLNIPSRFSGSLLDSTGTLTITGVQAEDEAVYFCGDWDVFGVGTRVTVISQPEVAPSLYVFQPSSEQILKENKAILVCLIEGFYPKRVDVEWVADGTTLTNNMQTSLPVRQNDSKYMASSYLTLTANQWQNYSTYSCKVKHEAGNVEKTVNRSEYP